MLTPGPAHRLPSFHEDCSARASTQGHSSMVGIAYERVSKFYWELGTSMFVLLRRILARSSLKASLPAPGEETTIMSAVKINLSASVKQKYSGVVSPTQIPPLLGLATVTRYATVPHACNYRKMSSAHGMSSHSRRTCQAAMAKGPAIRVQARSNLYNFIMVGIYRNSTSHGN